MTYTVKQARKLADRTQAQMAEEMNISRGVYINLEKSPWRATIGQARDIARITGLTLDQIFFGKNST